MWQHFNCILRFNNRFSNRHLHMWCHNDIQSLWLLWGPGFFLRILDDRMMIFYVFSVAGPWLATSEISWSGTRWGNWNSCTFHRDWTEDHDPQIHFRVNDKDIDRDKLSSIEKKHGENSKYDANKKWYQHAEKNRKGENHFKMLSQHSMVWCFVWIFVGGNPLIFSES